ncbi:AAA-like domain-containing protein [Oscillatoriales cyanobacterium LEGE 11467]|uniref:AAA-like domain-containing protein n=1 Tax=Zarconia navalis LEGE 11467 TaxID=1828826 RepID=A0A928VTY8_9CYAN|nr:AAA-like domain-containing protein [Zarconia navalis]MBE9040101.1 AAA-like domain-containing protein [Zarconia navalis LEGE 11467]
MEKNLFPQDYNYQVGGCLPEEALTYVTRTADSELLRALKQGKFCYVLNCRQMGKSSLRVQTKKELEKQDIACVVIDLNEIGTNGVTAEQWYSSIVAIITRSLSLQNNFLWREWWKKNKHLSVVNRLTQFLRDVVLTKVNKDIVILIDEIDTILSLDFAYDDFFTFIRSWYENRVNQPINQRLTFAVFGVTEPSNLISKKGKASFNIDVREIELHGFEVKEVTPLEKGLKQKSIFYKSQRITNTRKLMESILYWTGGQPFLTQKLCQLISSKRRRVYNFSSPSLQNQSAENLEKRLVADIVKKHIINNWKDNDKPEHFSTINKSFLEIKDSAKRKRLLRTYQQILNKKKVIVQDSSEETELLLTGLVIKQGKYLKAFNPIYTEVFDENWIDSLLLRKAPQFLPLYTKKINALRKFIRTYKLKIIYSLIGMTVLGIIAGCLVGILIWIKQSYPEVFILQNTQNYEQLERKNIQRKTVNSEQEKDNLWEFVRKALGIGATEAPSAKRGTTTPQSTPKFQDLETFNLPEERKNQDLLDPQSSLILPKTFPPETEFFDEEIFDVPKEDIPTQTRSKSSVTLPISLSTSIDEKSQPFTVSRLKQAQPVFTRKEWQIITQQFRNTPFLGKKGISPFESNFFPIANGISRHSSALQQGGAGLSRWALLLVEKDKLGNYYAIDTRQVQVLGQDLSSLHTDEPYEVWRTRFVVQIAFPHLVDGGRVAKRHVLLEGECPQKFNSKRQFAMKRLWFSDYDREGNQVTIQQIDEKIRLLEPQGSQIKYEVLVSACEAAYDYPRYLELLVEGQKPSNNRVFDK